MCFALLRRSPALRWPPALLAVALLLVPLVTSAAARDYRIDPVHTRVLFSVDHLGFSRALGTLSGPRGTLRFDPKDWSSANVEVELDLDRLDLGDGDWNARMLKRDFFDAERHPLARFRSTSVEPLDSQRARVHGLLSLRGTEQPVVLEVRFNRRARNPLSLRSTVGFSATATLSRAAFGMDTWKTMVGDAVEIRIEVEAKRSRATGREDDDDAMAQHH